MIPKPNTETPILSPFSDTENRSPLTKKKRSFSVGILLGLFILIIVTIGGFFLFQHLNDPLRTLEPFPVAKYLDSYKSLSGAKFRGALRVENDLGWKEGAGKLMAFSLRDDPRFIVVMIPPQLAQIYFTKGQNYEAELEVKEGGVIYANSIRKN